MFLEEGYEQPEVPAWAIRLVLREDEIRTFYQTSFYENPDFCISKNAFKYCKNLTIHAPAGSHAEQYAKKHNIPFIPE